MSATVLEVGTNFNVYRFHFPMLARPSGLSFHAQQRDFLLLIWFRTKQIVYYLPIQLPPSRDRVQMFESSYKINYTRIIKFCLEDKKESRKHVSLPGSAIEQNNDNMGR